MSKFEDSIISYNLSTSMTEEQANTWLEMFNNLTDKQKEALQAADLGCYKSGYAFGILDFVTGVALGAVGIVAINWSIEGVKTLTQFIKTQKSKKAEKEENK